MLIESNTIYPIINSNIDLEKIKNTFTPTDKEIIFAADNTNGKLYQLLLLTVLKSYQKYRRFIQVLDLPFAVIAYIARVINFAQMYPSGEPARQEKYFSIFLCCNLGHTHEIF